MDSSTFRRIRLGLGLTGDELGARLQVSGTYIRLIESGRKPVSSRIEAKIKDELQTALHSSDPFFALIRTMLLSQSPDDAAHAPEQPGKTGA
ncbi:MAG: helix-turn-helix domain-containing protein [Proteobacteria bacterium]|uniref:Helix-turn-helix domain-containing protein n=1 Tax=Candidatus Avisuccinivibrio stercorigallinarum TaxID=2840704 RepID=A0A9D9DCE5_9GAMM|nr:helix-turn-helix domain-containing protein [Candidatus Avisuccinivibrio stercorigallinarum]